MELPGIDFGTSNTAAVLHRNGQGVPQLMPEPAAAAWYFITTLGRLVAPGRCVVVYDFGAGTFDVAVLHRSPQGFDVLAADGLADLGGLDLDAAIVDRLPTLTPHAAAAWGQLDWPQTAADRRARTVAAV
jgi:molecular chaperone DnaK (HSP70)